MKSLTLMFFLAVVCFAQLDSQRKSKGYVTIDVIPTLTLRAGQTGSAELRFRVNPGYHVNSHNPGNPLLIPTELDFQSIDAIKVGKISYPKGEQLALEFAPEDKLSVYSGEIIAQVPVTAAKNAAAGQYAVKGELKYQACNDRSCFPPKSLPVEITVVVKSTSK